MLIRGGENIFPVEIENELYRHPRVRDVQVVGVPHETLGEEVCAFVIPQNPAEPVTHSDIAAFLHKKVSHFKVPRYVFNVNEFPMTVTGKVQKFMLRDLAVKELKTVS